MGRSYFFLPLDLRTIVAISVILATTTAECPSGFVLNPGTISGTGQLGYHKNIESIDDCSQLCKAEEYCCAFEYSDSRKRCYINVDCNPTKGVYKDYEYCTKDSGKVDCVTISSDKYKPCVFPVLWKGEYRNECIASGSKWWCATELKDDGQYQKFGHCGDSCPREGITTIAPQTTTQKTVTTTIAPDVCEGLLDQGRSSNISMRQGRAPVAWNNGVCSVPGTTKRRMKLSSVVAGYPPLYTDTAQPPPITGFQVFPSDIAHVYPCGQIKHNVNEAVVNWNPCRKRNLERFTEWLFEIDDEAVIQEVFLTNNVNNYVPFEDYLERAFNDDGSNNGDGHSPVYGPFGFLYDVFNTNELNYDTAMLHIITQDPNVVPDDVWANRMVKYLTQAPANLRYGNKPTNGFISCKIDPVGNNNGFPTTKECQMIRGVAAAAGGPLVPENLKRDGLPSGQYFTSTGLLGGLGPNVAPCFGNCRASYANPTFANALWQACMTSAPSILDHATGLQVGFTLHYDATVNAQNRGFSCGEDDENGSGTDDECCANLELTLENDASANQGQRAGNYEIQAENFNDRNVWKRDDGQYVLWFNSDTDYWTIGSSLGSGGGIFAPSEFDCPNDAGSQWTYYEVGSSNTFLDAGNDVSLICQGDTTIAPDTTTTTAPGPCPSGYVLNAGSISKSGQLGYKKNIESIDDCGQLCDAKEYCCAFEYSDSKKRCYMNVDCNPTKDAYKDYNYCMKEAGEVDCVTVSSDKHKPCVFPVLWKGEYHDKCVLQGSTGKTWCATELKDSGKYKKWGHCGDSCPKEE